MRFSSARSNAGLRTALAFPVTAILLAMAGCSSSVPIGSSVDNRPSYQMPQPGAGGTYTVQRGDNIYGIARLLNVPVRALIDANHLQPPFQVSVGQVLVLPGQGTYVVAANDTLSGIARKTGVPFSTLARINNLSAPYVVRVGQKLKLPGDAPDAAVASGGGGAPTAVPPSDVARPVAVASLPPPAAAPSEKGSSASYTSLAERENRAQAAAVIPPPPPPPAAAQSQAAQPSSVPSSAPAMSASASSAAVPAEQRAASTQVAAASPAPVPPAPPAGSGKSFIWPVHGTLLAEFGSTGKGQHNDGINIAVPRGTPVVAAQDGVVAYSGNELRGFGNLLLIKHADGWMTAYAHNDTLLVKRGETVRRGQQIATAGDSGGVSQPQVHFEVRQGTRAVDPMTFLGGGRTTPAAAPDDPDG